MRRLWSKDLVEETTGLSPHERIKQEQYSGTLDGGIEYWINTDLGFVRLRHKLTDGTLQCYQPYGQEGLLIGDIDLAMATGRLAMRTKMN